MTSEVLTQVQSRCWEVKALGQGTLPRAAESAGLAFAQLLIWLDVFPLFLLLLYVIVLGPLSIMKHSRVFSNPDAIAVPH